VKNFLIRIRTNIKSKTKDVFEIKSNSKKEGDYTVSVSELPGY